MRALSLWQPWAWAVIHAGKDVENRSWKTTYRGPLLIHASKRKPTGKEMRSFSDDLVETLGREKALPLIGRLTQEIGVRGGIVGCVDVVDCVSDFDSPWFFGPFGLVLSNPRPIQFVPVLGQRGFFEVELEGWSP